MRKGWRIVSAIALICFLVGVAGIGIGFFTGSSPTALQAHGNLSQYGERLSANWAILQQDFAALRQTVSDWQQAVFDLLHIS